jgi:hypothetical protein
MAAALMRGREFVMSELRYLKQKVGDGPSAEGETREKRGHVVKFEELPRAPVRERRRSSLKAIDSLALPQVAVPAHNFTVGSLPEDVVPGEEEESESESESEPEPESEGEDEERDIPLDSVSRTYLDDESYLELTASERREALTSRYFAILGKLFGRGKKVAKRRKSKVRAIPPTAGRRVAISQLRDAVYQRHFEASEEEPIVVLPKSELRSECPAFENVLFEPVEVEIPGIEQLFDDIERFLESQHRSIAEQEHLLTLLEVAKASAESEFDQEHIARFEVLLARTDLVTPPRKARRFATESRVERDGLIILEKKLTFTRDLVDAITEGARRTRPMLLKYYDDISQIKPFEGINRLKDTVVSRLGPQPANLGPRYAEEYSLTVGGTSPRRSIPISQRSRQMIRRRDCRYEVDETALLKVDSITVGRSKTSLTPVVQSDLTFDSPAQTRPQTPAFVNRRKPRPTPTQPVFPTNEINSGAAVERKPPSQPRTPSFPKWKLAPTESVSQDDIDFFMFCTPYVMPPELLNEMLDE